MFSVYATLADVRRELKAQNTLEDDIVWSLLIQASARLDAYTDHKRPFFEPWHETRAFPLYPARVSSLENSFLFSGPLLELESVTIGADTFNGTQVEGWPSLRPPYNQVAFINFCDGWYRFCSGSKRYPRVEIKGVWGWTRDYEAAWYAADALQAAITSSVTALTVDDADGLGKYGLAPRFSAGNLIRIDDEYMRVIATNTASNVVTVLRAQNGTEAAAHDEDAAIDIWQQDVRIVRIVSRQAGMMYARRGAYQVQEINDLGTIQYPADLLAEFRGVMAELAYE